MGDKERTVSNSDLAKLRTQGLISTEEIALIIGDAVVAENVLNKSRRIIEVGSLMLESNRRLLRD
tara:strand:- start:71 stop:265 length:195 start_codon:yes stop_codon:yes gene_type:complete